MVMEGQPKGGNGSLVTDGGGYAPTPMPYPHAPILEVLHAKKLHRVFSMCNHAILSDPSPPNLSGHHLQLDVI